MAKKSGKRTRISKDSARARRTAARTGPAKGDVLLAPMKGAERRTVGGVRMDVARAGAARVKRVVYPAGFRWSVDMKPVTGTDLCMHAHVGFLARGRIRIEYADGCRQDYRAPQVVTIEPGHDGCVVGTEPVVLIEIDFEGETATRLGLPEVHRHTSQR